MGSQENNAEEVTQRISFNQFFESVPPNKQVIIESVVGNVHGSIRLPNITLHCDGENCNGNRFFSPEEDTIYLKPNVHGYKFLTYTCNNCRKTFKIFAVAIKVDNKKNIADAFKFGEYPPFGPPTPSKLTELIGPDKEFFLLGRRCENQGMGIGAFVYYRRVVEDQKNRIFESIIQVARKINLKTELIVELEEAKKETQLSKAVDSIKHALPESLLIDGQHNPLTLLHKALSEGVHDKSDSDCLGIAESIRVVLTELANKLNQALKNKAELNKAVSKLMNRV